MVSKYIGEQEAERRTLDTVVKTWEEYGQGKGNYRADFEQSRKDIFSGDYGKTYEDFADLVKFPVELKNEHYKQIHEELGQYHLHGCNFDVFGAIYEAFASQTKKKQFGEFYTRRHITRIVAELLLRGETVPRAMKVCDPACGTGGFLTEAYKALRYNYSTASKWNKAVQSALEQSTFWGFDIDDKSVAKAKLNMFMVGDGHTHIHKVDALTEWEPKLGWEKEQFDYILTNPPMGSYNGNADINDFQYTNERRYEMLFAERVIAATKPGGEIAIVVPDGMLEAPSREGFRKKLLVNCDLVAVVALTRFAFAPYTQEKTYVLFLQKKQADDVGTVQSFPIWHFIVDYDGFANSDKRFHTKWHDDLPVLEQKFAGAVALARKSVPNPAAFDAGLSEFEADVNQREWGEGLWGRKYGYVPMKDIGGDNFHNLLSEFHLRPKKVETVAEAEFEKRADSLLAELSTLVREASQ